MAQKSAAEGAFRLIADGGGYGGDWFVGGSEALTARLRRSWKAISVNAGAALVYTTRTLDAYAVTP